jgi:hypothetical protein
VKAREVLAGRDAFDETTLLDEPASSPPPTPSSAQPVPTGAR